MSQKRTIVYGVMGEGRGHATRSLAVSEQLQARGYRVVVLTSGDALALLRAAGCELFEVPPFNFVYHGARVQRPQTASRLILSLLRLLARRGDDYREVRKRIVDLDPACVITDMEPYSARAAQELGLPLIAIDHQHTLLSNSIPPLDHGSRLALSVCRPFIRRLFRAQETIAASFYHFDPNASRNVHHILRAAITNAPHARIQNHVTVYIKRNIHYWDKLRWVFELMPQEVFHVYSDFTPDQLSTGPSLPNVTLSGINESSFVQSLKDCKALICTAGNQTIGEAMYLRKPILAIPEPLAFEQEVNGLGLERSECGEVLRYDHFAVGRVAHFLERLPLYRQKLEAYLSARPRFDSTVEVASKVEAVLRAV